MNVVSFTVTIFACFLSDVLCSIWCNTSGYCQNEILCDVYQDSEQILKKLQFSEENPGSPRCNAITACADSDCFRFCWRSPDDVSSLFMSGFRVYIIVGDHPMEFVSMLITLHKNSWQQISIIDKKEAVFCVTCVYQGVQGLVNGYVWSQPSHNKTHHENKACSAVYHPPYLDTAGNNFPWYPTPHWTTVNAGKSGTLVKKSLSATRTTSRLNSGHIAAIVVGILVLGSATFGVILFLVKRKGGLESHLYCDEDLDIDLRKPRVDQEDFVSAVTIGTGNLPAPTVGGNLTSNYEVEELHVLMSNAHRTMKMQSHSGCMQCEERDSYDDTSV